MINRGKACGNKRGEAIIWFGGNLKHDFLLAGLMVVALVVNTKSGQLNKQDSVSIWYGQICQ